MISLQHFSTQLDAKQIKKGREYFNKGAVEDTRETKTDTWEAAVNGSDMYYVKIKLANELITSTSCDCPHDDPFCKHVVAVLFSIQEEKNILVNDQTTTKDQTLKRKAAPKTASFETVLAKTSENELREFVQSFAERNKEFKNLFLLRFELSKQENSIEKYRSLIKRTAATYKKQGFIDYYASTKAVQPVLDILDEAELHLAKGNYRIVFDGACAIMLELPEVLLQMDDSNGVAGDCIYRSFDYLEELASTSDVPYSLKDEILDFATANYGNKSFSEFGFEDHFLPILVAVAYEKEQQQKVFSLIEKQLKVSKNDFHKKALLDAKMGLLIRTGNTAEAVAILYSHRYIFQYREQLLEQKLAAKEYEIAKQLAEEGLREEKKAERWHRTTRWEQWLLQIAILQQDVDAIRHYSKELYFLRSGCDIQHYKIYRSTYSEEDWKQEYPKWIKWFTDKGKITPVEMYALADVYITEKLYEKIAGLLRMNPDYKFAEYCRPHVQKQYSPELMTAYRQSLINFAADNVGRNHYIALRKMLTNVQKLNGGKELVAALVPQFKQKFKQRSAMIEELGKIKL